MHIVAEKMGKITLHIFLLVGMAGGIAFAEPSAIATPANDMDWKGLPEGTGREDVFYTCQACHSLMLVKQQHLSRERWQEILAWMVKEKGMVEPDPKVRDSLLGYLSTHFGPSSGRPAGLGSMPPPLSTMRP